MIFQFKIFLVNNRILFYFIVALLFNILCFDNSVSFCEKIPNLFEDLKKITKDNSNSEYIRDYTHGLSLRNRKSLEELMRDEDQMKEILKVEKLPNTIKELPKTIEELPKTITKYFCIETKD
jgi:hypothetical protein